MSRYSFSRSLLVVIALLILSSIAPHVVIARPNPAPTPEPAQCSSVPCGGSCAICPPCPPGAICPKAPCRLGACQTDASGMCQCAPVPAPTPAPQCSGIPCGGSCVIAPSCSPGAPCPQFLILGQCTQDTSGTCRCVPAQLPTPTPSPAPECSSVPCGGPCTFVSPPFPCPRGDVCNGPNVPILPGQCEVTAAGCGCVPVQAPTATATPTPIPPQCSSVPCGGSCTIPSPPWCPPNAFCVEPGQCELSAAGSCDCVPLASPTPTTCIDNVLCIRGTHWSSAQCRCIRDRRPHAPHSPLGHSPHTIQAPHQPHTPG
jgi:hypothetical protein